MNGLDNSSLKTSYRDMCDALDAFVEHEDVELHYRLEGEEPRSGQRLEFYREEPLYKHDPWTESDEEDRRFLAELGIEQDQSEGGVTRTYGFSLAEVVDAESAGVWEAMYDFLRTRTNPDAVDGSPHETWFALTYEPQTNRTREDAG